MEQGRACCKAFSAQRAAACCAVNTVQLQGMHICALQVVNEIRKQPYFDKIRGS